MKNVTAPRYTVTINHGGDFVAEGVDSVNEVAQSLVNAIEGNPKLVAGNITIHDFTQEVPVKHTGTVATFLAHGLDHISTRE